jgi:preprotein translocase subunit YajC
MLFFISSAFADEAAAKSGGLLSFLPFIAFVVILYFLLLRPQQKKQKQHQALVAAIKKGDKVITNSGIIATVSKVINDGEVVLEISNGVHCKFVKSTISSIVSSAPVADVATTDVETTDVATEKQIDATIEETSSDEQVEQLEAEEEEQEDEPEEKVRSSKPRKAGQKPSLSRTTRPIRPSRFKK